MFVCPHRSSHFPYTTLFRSERFSFFIYRFNGPIMRQMFSHPNNTWQLEQSVISMLAGDLFDTPKVLRRLRLFKLVYAIIGMRDWRSWRAGHNYRLAQARAEVSGGNPVVPRLRAVSSPRSSA